MPKRKTLSAGQERAWRAMLHGHSLLMSRLDGELREQAGLSLIEYEVLARLSEATQQRLAMAELARALRYSRSGLTRLIDVLEARELVTREHSKIDRRSWSVVLTAAGFDKVEEAWIVHGAGVVKYFGAHVNPHQALAITKTFNAIIEDLVPHHTNSSTRR